MTLRARIILLAVLAAVGMIFTLALQYRNFGAQSQHIETVRHNVDLLRALSDAVHQLQKERGLSAITAGDKDKQELARQIQTTDAALRGPAMAGIPDVTQLRGALARVREGVANENINPLVARDEYSSLVQALLDEMDELGKETGVVSLRELVSAHAHLVGAKEFLGQIRATIGYWIEQGNGNAVVLHSVARLQGSHEEKMRKLRLAISPELREILAAKFSGPEVSRTLQIAAKAALTGTLPEGIDSAAWFQTATAAIDRLKLVEDHSLQLIERKADEELAKLRDTTIANAATTLVVTFVILALAASAAISLLRALNRALVSIDNISASKDFSARIPIEQPEEIGRISRSFNELLKIAEHLLKEKDYLAQTDALTGIYNRLRFKQGMHEEAERRQKSKTPLSLIIFDIDYFKHINDTFGHGAGDAVLKALAELVSKEVRTTDLLCRWGGEEFVLLLRDSDCEAALKLADKLRRRIAATDFPGVGKVTCSFGVSSWEGDHDTDERLLRRADDALYRSKHNGRNRVSCSQVVEVSCTDDGCDCSSCPPRRGMAAA